MSDPARDAAALTAFGLPTSSSLDFLGDAPLESDRWRRLLSTCRRERLDGLLYAALDAGALHATPQQHEQAAQQHQRCMAGALLLERELLAVLTDARGVGVEPLVLKGPAVAHQDYPDPSWRPFGDLDLLVQPEQLATFELVLRGRDGTRRFPEPRPGFDRRFSKGYSYRMAQGIEVDVHRSLATGPFGLTIDPWELAASPGHIVLAGQHVATLDRTRRFLHACVHAALGGPTPRLLVLRDVAQLAPADETELANALEYARRWRLAAVVHDALRHSAEVLGWEPPEPVSEWARTHVLKLRETRWLTSYRGDDRSTARQAMHTVSVVPGVAAKVAYARAVLLPQQTVGSRTRLDRLRVGARQLRRQR